jgi:hypothetical protein
LNHIFQVGFFNLVGQGILQPLPEIPPFQSNHNLSGIPVPPHVSMRPESLANDGWKEIVKQLVVLIFQYEILKHEVHSILTFYLNHKKFVATTRITRRNIMHKYTRSIVGTHSQKGKKI